MEIPLDRIQNVRFHQGIFERMIGAGDIILESAGEQGTNTFSEIRHPESVQKVIYEQSEAYQGRFTAPAAPAAPPGVPDVSGELQRLADLRDRGVITDAEFKSQKARLLGE